MQNHETEARFNMARIVAGMSTKSDKIRALGAAGYSRSDIARFLEIRYQHVRNVLVAEEAKQASPSAPEEAQPSEETSPKVAWSRVGEGGRVVLPSAFRRQLGIEEGDDVQLAVEDDRMILRTPKAVVRDLQSFFARARDPDRSVVDTFIAERRAMWGED
jgi:AbrB family looped-hinge helix DNA binding protein